MRTTIMVLVLCACGVGDKPEPSGIPDTAGTTSGVVPPSQTGGTTPTGQATPTTSMTPTGTTEPTDALIAFEGGPPQNILWVSIDTLRRDRFERYGGVSHMPFLDGLIAQSVVFDDVMQCSNWTGAGTSCTMSGRHGVDAGFEPPLSAREAVDLVPEDTVFIAEALRDAGWHTVLFSTNGWLAPEWGNTQGFDVTESRDAARANGVMEDARGAVVAAPTDRPWFAHVHLYDPHAPYNPPEKWLGALDGREELPWDLSDRPSHYDARDIYHTLDPDTQLELKTQLIIRYDAELKLMDSMLEVQWELWDNAGLLDDTLVVFWADHGEAFWEHGRQTHAYHLFDEENAVAMWMWAKNLRPNHFDGPVSSIDLAPTVLDLYDVPVPETMTGLQIPDAIPADRVRYAMSIARSGAVQSVRRGAQRIHHYWASGQVVVTDADIDPLERQDLYDPTDPLTLELWELLKPRVEQAEGALDVTRWPITWPPELPR